MSKLLSIAIPTKNRQEFLFPLLDLFLTMDLTDIEIIIQDNSDDESVIRDYLKKHMCEAFRYFHQDGALSQMENSELAIGNCKGKFVCFLGDDDYVSRYLIDYVRLMDQYSYDCSIFKPALYMWSGVSTKAQSVSKLTIGFFEGKIFPVSVKKEYRSALKHGCLFMNKLPQLYQAVVLRKRLIELKERCGVFFPGPSPDMAIATVLCKVIKRMVYCDVPYISSGQSNKSASGLGILHQHKGELSKIKMLPQNIEDRWLPQIPKIWTGATIYAQSSNEAMKAFGDKNGLRKYNWNYFYAYFTISSPEYRELLGEAVENCLKYRAYKYYFYIIKVFVDKCVRYIKVRVESNIRAVNKIGLQSTLEAGKMTDEIISGVNIEKMFGKRRK